MASSLLALLSQQVPTLQTRKALIVLGLQHDFVSADGKLPVNQTLGFLDRLQDLVPAFREFGDVIWVRSEFQARRAVNRPDESSDSVIAGPLEDQPEDDSEEAEDSLVPPEGATSSTNDTDQVASTNISREATESSQVRYQLDDEELFLTPTATRPPCCVPGSAGAAYASQIKDLIDERKDMHIVKSYYSAIRSTPLLITLRSKLITELYICGCMTNTSVFATAMDAASHGIKVTLVEDCLGYRTQDRHDLAIKRLREIMEADVRSGAEVIGRLRNPPPPSESEEDDDGDDEDDDDIAVGEDAAGMSADMIQAHSDREDEEEEEPLVRPLFRSTRALEHRFATREVYSSRSAAIDPKHHQPTPPQPSEPASSRAANPSGPPVPYGQYVSEPGRFGRRDGKREAGEAHGFELGQFGRGTGDKGVVRDDESSKRLKPAEPWVDLIERHWHEQEAKQSILPARSTHLGLTALSAAVGLDQRTVNEYEEMMKEAQRSVSVDEGSRRVPMPLFGEDKEAESAGSGILYDLLPAESADSIFNALDEEVTWQHMHHQTGEVPRLVCCQGTIDAEGNMPVYRHPSDQTLPIQSWTSAVDRARQAAEAVVGHELNHVLIQKYRTGTDYISEHSDKTLDIAKGSFIVNVSFGAQRTMRLRTKRVVAATSSGEHVMPSRTTYRVPMPHNSMIIMSLETNAEYLHGINADKRPAVELSNAEKAYDGQRISLTFRKIATFLNHDSSRIWGQGAVGKTKEDSRGVINGDAIESEKLIMAFGSENQARSIEWDSVYKQGSDVLHLK